MEGPCTREPNEGVRTVSLKSVQQASKIFDPDQNPGMKSDKNLAGCLAIIETIGHQIRFTRVYEEIKPRIRSGRIFIR